MAVKVDVRATGLRELELILRRAQRRAKDLKPVLRGPITNSIHQFFRRQFASEGQAGGERWAPLTPVTRSLKARHHRSEMGTLRFTNRMWASLTKRSGPESVVVAGPQSLEVGTTNRAAVFHQQGWTSLTIFGKTRRVARRVQPRRIVPENLPSSLVKAWERLLVRHLEKL